MEDKKNTTCTRSEWIDFVEQFQENEGLITFNEAESLVMWLLEQGELEGPQPC